MRQADPPPPTSLEGQFLIAMPSLREGPFARSVVYMCAHRDDGAMGIVINHRAEEIDFGQLLTQLVLDPLDVCRLLDGWGAGRTGLLLDGGLLLVLTPSR